MSSEAGHSVYGEHGQPIQVDNETWGSENSTMWDNSANMRGVIHVPRGTQHLQSFRYVCEVGIAFPLALLGIVGNMLAIVVLFRHKQRLTTTVILLALAVADILILLSTISVRSVRYLDPMIHFREGYHYLFRWIYPATYFFRLTGTWLTVLLTVERFIAVCHPLKASSLCSLSRTYIIMTFLTVFGALFSLPRVFEWEMVTATHPVHNITRTFSHQTELTESTAYNFGYRIFLFFLVMYLIPMSLLTVLNTKLLIALRLSRIQRASLQLTPHVSTNSRNDRSVTIIVITVVLVCIVCNICAMAGHILWSIPMAYKHLGPDLDIYRRYISNISNVLVTLNSAINLVIYYLCSRNFRSILCQTLQCEAGVETPQPETLSLVKRYSGGSDNTQSTIVRNSVRSESNEMKMKPRSQRQ